MDAQAPRKSRVGFWLRILASVLLLGFVLYLVDPRKVWEQLQRANLGLFFLFFPVFGIVGIIGAVRWRMLLLCQEIDITLWEALKLTLLGYFFSLTPAGLVGGDLAKAIYASRNTPYRARAAVSVVMDRLVGTVALGTIALVGLLIRYNDPIIRRAWPVVAVMVTLTGAICVIFFFGRLWGMDWLAKRFPLGGISEELLTARDYYRKNTGTLLAALGISFLGHFGCISLFYGYGLSLGVEAMGYMDYIIAVPTISFISCLASMGLGIGELSSKWLFEAKGVAEDVSVAISLMYRISLFAWSSLGGLVAVFYRHPKSSGDILPDDTNS